MSSTTHTDLMKFFKKHPFGGAKKDQHFCHSSLEDLLSRAEMYGANEKELELMKHWYVNYFDYRSGAECCWNLIDRLTGEWKGLADSRQRHYGLYIPEDKESDKWIDDCENEVFRRMILADHIPHCCDAIEFGGLDNICRTILEFSETMMERGAKVGDLYEDHNDMFWALDALNLMAKRGELDPHSWGTAECQCFKA
jgi:hypothetical protein